MITQEWVRGQMLESFFCVARKNEHRPGAWTSTRVWREKLSSHRGWEGGMDHRCAGSWLSSFLLTHAPLTTWSPFSLVSGSAFLDPNLMTNINCLLHTYYETRVLCVAIPQGMIMRFLQGRALMNLTMVLSYNEGWWRRTKLQSCTEGQRGRYWTNTTGKHWLWFRYLGRLPFRGSLKTVPWRMCTWQGQDSS